MTATRYQPLIRVGWSLLLLGGVAVITPTARISAQSLPSLKPTQPAALEQLDRGLALIQQGQLPDAI
ncbi:MAG TPA: hypothetical protein V6C85_15900, partial [Allocoleopsis sp.]